VFALLAQSLEKEFTKHRGNTAVDLSFLHTTYSTTDLDDARRMVGLLNRAKNYARHHLQGNEAATAKLNELESLVGGKMAADINVIRSTTCTTEEQERHYNSLLFLYGGGQGQQRN
jgi:hypothetical protein